MEKNLERLERSQVRVNFQLTPEEVNECLERTARELASTVQIPGFRPGRAPSKVVEAKLGKQTLRSEALQSLLPQLLGDVLTEDNISFLGYPRYDYNAEELDWGKSFSFNVTMDVSPEVKLATYKGVEVQKKLQPVTDEMVQKVIQQYLERYSELVPSEKTKVENGDFAVIDLEGKIGDEVVPGSTAEGYTIELGSGYLEEKLESGIVGMEVGEKKVISIDYPEDHPNKDIAGKTIDFSVTLTAIQEREYPDLDDEFAQDVSGYESLDEWKAQIRQRLEEQADARAENKVLEELVTKVVEESETELPPFTLESYKESAEQRMRLTLAYQGISWDEYKKALADEGKDSQEVITSIAEKEMKEELVLQKIAEEENLQPSSEEIEARVKELKSSRPKEDEESLQSLASYQLRLEKARQFIRENAVVEEIQENEQEDGSEENEHLDSNGGGTD